MDISDVRDNQFVLIKHLCEKGYLKKYKVIVYTKNKSWINIFNKYQVKCVNGFLIGLYYRVTSKYVFWAFGSNFMSCYSPKKQLTVDLWHGFGLKKIEYEVIDKDKRTFPIECTFNKVIIPSKHFNNMIVKSLHCSDEQIWVTGSPKVDELYTKGIALKNLGIFDKSYNKIVFFLPTYRNSKRLGYNNHTIDIPLLNFNNLYNYNMILKKFNVCLIVKLHHTAQRDFNSVYRENSLSNIYFFSNDDFDKYDKHFYNSLGQSDALITDYSSVYQDFLVLNKPIGFAIEDIEEYKKIRGFNFDNPIELMPGEIIMNENDFEKFIYNLSYNIDEYENKRNMINKILNNDTKNINNCSMLLNKCGIYLNETNISKFNK